MVAAGGGEVGGGGAFEGGGVELLLQPRRAITISEQRIAPTVAPSRR